MGRSEFQERWQWELIGEAFEGVSVETRGVELLRRVHDRQ